MGMSSPFASILKIHLVLCLLGIWAVPAPPATAQDQTLTGWFSIMATD